MKNKLDQRVYFKARRGSVPLESALILGTMLVIVLTLTMFLAREVYRSGLESLFNYADNNWVYKTEHLNLKKTKSVTQLRQGMVIQKEPIQIRGSSRRKVMNMSFNNKIDNSTVHRRMLMGQVVMAFYENQKGENTDQ